MNESKFAQLLDIMHTIRKTCPVAAHKTSSSLAFYAIEEAYELEDAIRSDDAPHICEELGDVLLQVIFHSELYQERGLFNFDDVVDTLSAKLIRRHPHVFDANHAGLHGNLEQKRAQIKQQWQEGKAKERKTDNQDPLHQVKPGPALIQSEQLQQAAATFGFDWPDVGGAMDKLHEEVAELDEAIHSGDIAHIEDELGDCLFSLVNVARKLTLNSELALLGTTAKFRRRLTQMALLAKQQNASLEQLALPELEALWQHSKRLI